MRPLDWVVLVGSGLFVILFALYRSRGSNTVDKYLLAGKTMPWYAMALSIMATQASAITFISTTGQSYVDGMRFVQFYFGLPIAMVILAATVVPVFHRTRVYTAYEYLEKRFDSKTRVLGSVIFLLQRGLSAGITIYAPAIVLSVILGWPERLTTVLVAMVVITYTSLGGIKAVTWSDFQQMIIIFIGLLISLGTVIYLLPHGVSFTDATYLAGMAGRLNAVTTTFSWQDRFNVWSGLLGGTFLFLSYFGCDQSQVQRYLTGKSIAQSRLSLLFTAVAKIPMQAFVLFIGAMVFVFYSFNTPPLLFHHGELQRIQSSPAYAPISTQHEKAFEQRREAANALLEARRSGNERARERSLAEYRAAQSEMDSARSNASKLVGQMGGEEGFNDTNYVFLTFVTQHLPVGIVGLVIAAILAAAMSNLSAALNSLSSTAVIDFYLRLRPQTPEHRRLLISRSMTVLWGVLLFTLAIVSRQGGRVVEVGLSIVSVAYGALLGVFLLGVLTRRASEAGAMIGTVCGFALDVYLWQGTNVPWTWYVPFGTCVTFAIGYAASLVHNKGRKKASEVTKVSEVPKP
jgi:Na+/proline symporter